MLKNKNAHNSNIDSKSMATMAWIINFAFIKNVVIFKHCTILIFTPANRESILPNNLFDNYISIYWFFIILKKICKNIFLKSIYCMQLGYGKLICLQLKQYGLFLLIFHNKIKPSSICKYKYKNKVKHTFGRNVIELLLNIENYN